MLILRRQNQRFETLIQNADPKRPSREYCSCFPREEDDFVSMHCALFTGPKLWNSFDQLLKEACSLNSFKYHLKMLFTEKY